MNELHASLHREMSKREDELIALHRRIVSVPSVNRGDGSSAREDEVAAVMCDYLSPLGIENRTTEGSPHRANFLARHGDAKKGRGKTLLFMSHSDVVPPGDESAWRFPPFSAEIADGRIWGRGSNDCKMLVAAELFAMASLARNGLLRRGELRIAVGADEEAGGKWGFGWLAQSEADFLRADLAVNEGGGAFFGKAAQGENLFTLGCGEKGRYEVVITAKGPGTHASVPWSKSNPLEAMSKIIERAAALEGEPFPASPIFKDLRKWMALDGEITRENLSATITEAGKKYSIAFRNSLIAQSRISFVPTVLQCGDKSNAVPTRAELHCDARIVPGQTRKDLEDLLQKFRAEFPDVEIAIDETAGSSVSPYDPPIESLFKSAIQRALGTKEVELLPTWCTGFTDSRFVRPVGTPVYGFQLVEPKADPDRLGIHCVDESIEVGMLLPCALSLAHLALEFCESD